MRQWKLNPGVTSAQGLVLEDVATPQPGRGQVRIRVSALSLNARDQMILAGPFGRPEGKAIVPLSDVAGTIEAVGEDVAGWSAGDRVMTAHVPTWRSGRAKVFGIGPGSLEDPGVAAEQIVVDAGRLIATPENLSDAEASTLQVAGVTAWNALMAGKPVGAGDKVLVFGSGGVALFAAQMAHALGAVPYAAVLTLADDPRWQQLGVAGVLTTDGEWSAKAFELTGGVDKVINTVGIGLVNECIAISAGSGEIAVVGLRATDVPELDMTGLTLKQVSVRGVAVGSVAMHEELARFTAKHDLHPVIDRRFAFADLPAAYEAQSSPDIFGKVVVEVA
ncbi:NAD(P)-dependent alcohol dehydrogenase [Streptomyces sp. NBC_01622]|uniref:zinc-dependent alcohol dehydrogenase family protein n=1 Tax=Streptomyces sp. NBC_01622 TaxID=2975903 RepID=UPI0038704271|nr:NAD(P)-dependent alcohol dehydrogenase [Streptomyces sp. NBC_01622]